MEQSSDILLPQGKECAYGYGEADDSAALLPHRAYPRTRRSVAEMMIYETTIDFGICAHGSLRRMPNCISGVSLEQSATYVLLDQGRWR